MAEQTDLAEIAHELLAQMRSQGAGLDGSDESIWFVQGALSSMAAEPPERGGGADRKFAYGVYLAELLASSCEGVRMEIESDGNLISEVSAVHADGVTHFVLSWVQRCVADPNADNIVFKFAGALRDFGQRDRADQIYEQLREFEASGHRF